MSVEAAANAPVAVGELRIEGLSVSRGGRPVLRDVSVTIPPGPITALLGPNGAGKSTLVLTVGGVLGATAGTVALGDHDLTGRLPSTFAAQGSPSSPRADGCCRG